MSVSAPAIVKAGSGLPSRVIFHSVEGIGKTSWAAQAPSPIFAMTRGETGLTSLIDNGQIPEIPHFERDFCDWLGLLHSIEWLIDNETPYKTFVLDTLNGAERLCFEFVTDQQFRGKWESFASFGRGVEQSLETWIRLLTTLDRLRERRKMGIICLCHTKVKTFKNPEGDDYDRYMADMHEKTWGQAHKWGDMVLFGNHETIAKKDRGEMKAKGASTGRRLIYTQRTACWDAKNRGGMPFEIDMGMSSREAWTNFYQAVRTARAANQLNGDKKEVTA